MYTADENSETKSILSENSMKLDVYKARRKMYKNPLYRNSRELSMKKKFIPIEVVREN